MRARASNWVKTRGNPLEIQLIVKPNGALLKRLSGVHLTLHFNLAQMARAVVGQMRLVKLIESLGEKDTTTLLRLLKKLEEDEG